MSILNAIGSKASSLHNRFADHLIERRLNIETTGRKDVRVLDAVPYSTFAYWSIFRVLDRLELNSEDVFADFGCGKGRVVCAAAMRPVKKSIGVDIDQQLCEQARSNAARMQHRCAPIEIVNCPAQEFDSSACTALFMFNPFGPGTLRMVLERVLESTASSRRAVRLAYVNPRLDHVVEELGGFERYDLWRFLPHGRLKFDVSFWRAHPRG